MDEGLKHVYRRQAMSKTNIGLITDVLPEVSKGHGRIIIITQIDKIDSDMINPVFCRAVWEKKTKKKMVCTSKHHGLLTFRNLPSVQKHIKFDPDRLAPLISTDLSKKTELRGASEIYQVCQHYAKGKSITANEPETGIHRETVKRHIRKGLEQFIEHEKAKRLKQAEPSQEAESVT